MDSASGDFDVDVSMQTYTAVEREEIKSEKQIEDAEDVVTDCREIDNVVTQN